MGKNNSHKKAANLKYAHFVIHQSYAEITHHFVGNDTDMMHLNMQWYVICSVVQAGTNN